MLIYNSLFESRLRYAILGWGTASDQAISKIKVLQNRAVRFITFSPFRTAMAPLYSTLKILPLNRLLFLQRNIFMHNLHYKNLPFTLGVYCHQPEHSHATRYATSMNYVLPHVSTNRSKGSIKFSGPKAWADLPTHLKEIAFRKPFSKKTKDHILTNIYVELPESNSFLDMGESAYNELAELFQTDDESEFYGFDASENVSQPELSELFLTDNDESDFDGFDTTPDLDTLFLSENETEDFMGF